MGIADAVLGGARDAAGRAVRRVTAESFESRYGHEPDRRRPADARRAVELAVEERGKIGNTDPYTAVWAAVAKLTDAEADDVEADAVERTRTAIHLFDEIHGSGDPEFDFDVDRPIPETPSMGNPHRKAQRNDLVRDLGPAYYEREFGERPPDLTDYPEEATEVVRAVGEGTDVEASPWPLQLVAEDVFRDLRDESSRSIVGTNPRTTDVTGNLDTIPGTSVTDDPDRLRAALAVDRMAFGGEKERETAAFLGKAVHRQAEKERLAEGAERDPSTDLDDVDPDAFVLTDRGVAVERGEEPTLVAETDRDPFGPDLTDPEEARECVARVAEREGPNAVATEAVAHEAVETLSGSAHRAADGEERLRASLAILEDHLLGSDRVPNPAEKWERTARDLRTLSDDPETAERVEARAADVEGVDLAERDGAGGDSEWTLEA